MTKHQLFLIHSLVPVKFSPLPAMVIEDTDGREHLAIDRGYGLEAPCEPSDASIEAMNAVEAPW